MNSDISNDVVEFIRVSRRADRSLAATLLHAQSHGEEFCSAIKKAWNSIYGPSPAKGTRAIHRELENVRKKMLRDAGVVPVRLPDRAMCIRAALRILAADIDGGKRASAMRACHLPGLDARQRKKLAYQTPINAQAVQAVFDSMPASSFAIRLKGAAGLREIVIGSHQSLSKLTRTVTNIQRFFSLQADPSIELGSKALLPTSRVGNRRGNWHPAAQVLRSRGKTNGEIARILGRSPNAVKKLFARTRASVGFQPPDSSNSALPPPLS